MIARNQHIETIEVGILASILTHRRRHASAFFSLNPHRTVVKSPMGASISHYVNFPGNALYVLAITAMFLMSLEMDHLRLYDFNEDVIVLAQCEMKFPA